MAYSSPLEQLAVLITLAHTDFVYSTLSEAYQVYD